ncbi:autotransporter domain-containing protein [Succinivibrio dextrinosolvens]|uniref:autotransporter domain-containing protein n=1 Tax=Succinivibrio dextrinosolvens TaxID=83771 RepID=UPI0013E9511E|nr:autotransporter domain-containing protein [Succinivibrio dextrinosolvens]
MSIKPLSIAVCSVLAGMPLLSDATSFDPENIGESVTISGTLTLTRPYSDVYGNPATFTITSTGVVNYPLVGGFLYCFNNNSSTTQEADTNNNNTIINYGTINGSTAIPGQLAGGFIHQGLSVDYGSRIKANNNTVSLRSGSTTSNVIVYGGYVYDSSTRTIPGLEVSGNTVFIEDGSNVEKVYVYGGYAETENTASSGDVTVTNNKVIIGSGTYTGTIFGGSAISTAGSQVLKVQDNTVYLYGNADLSGAGIKGGEAEGAGTKTVSGNMLVFGYNNQAWAPSNYTIGNVQNFSTIRFDNATWGKTITVNYFANHSTDSSVTKVDASKVAFSGVDSLSSGDSYDMLTIGELDSGSLALSSETSTYTVGTTLEGTGKVSLSENGKTVTYTVDSASEKASSQSHAAAMTMSAGTVALTQGADTTSAAGFNLANSGITGVQSFSSVGGGAARVETGSFVSLKTLNFSVGIGNNVQNDYGLLSIGGAFEAGYGKFKNHFDAGAADPYIKKTGHVSYYGLALLSNFTFENLWHVNGAVRVGRMESTQNNALYNAATGETYDINIGTNYYGLELGGGKLIKIDDTNSLDIYGKYFYLYQASDSFNAGGKYKLSAVNSNRLRVAGRYSHDFTPVTSLYGGAGLEHEFDGKSKLKVDDKAWAKSSKTKGTRAFGEIGVAVKPASNTGLILDFSVKGLYGDNFRGAWASADIKYMF